MEFDVDIVLPWVNGQDKEWQKEKNKYLSGGQESESIGENRYRDWGLMKYWFRAIEQYAPWVRTIHFVTWGHVPDFLKLDAEKLNIVTHDKFMPPGSLPTFNSCALELNVWRIPELSERFLYFNDDIFLIKPISKHDVFDIKSGLPRMQCVEMPLRAVSLGAPWQSHMLNDISLINSSVNKRQIPLMQYLKEHLSHQYSLTDNLRNLVGRLMYSEYFIGFKNYHGVAPLTKSLCEEFWRQNQEPLTQMSYMRFRESSTANQWAFQWYQMALGNFSPKKNGHIFFDIDDATGTLDKAIQSIQEHKYETICLNDPDYPIDFEKCRNTLIRTFDELLPNKSSFEK